MALLPLPWVPLRASPLRSVMKAPPLPWLDKASSATSVRRCWAPVPMPVAARSTTAALRTIRLSELAAPALSLRLLLRPLTMEPVVAYSKAPPSACKRLMVRLRPANRLAAPNPLEPTASKAWPSLCVRSRAALTSMKPSLETPA